jgi:hypothetical protein
MNLTPIHRHHILKTREQRLPLPGGEGWGEGGLLSLLVEIEPDKTTNKANS